DIDPPIISVSTTLPGANAQVVETAVTDVLEEELSTIQGLRTLSSSSSEENSQIILEFNLDRPVDVAAQDVRDKVSRVRGRLPGRSITVQDVERAINARNVEIPAGRIESTRREFSVRSLGELKNPREFGELVVTSQGGQVVKLKDVAHVELAPEDTRSIFRYNGNPAVAIGVVRQSKANLIDVAQRIREAIPGIQQTLPPGVKLETAFDGSLFVTHSI